MKKYLLPLLILIPIWVAAQRPAKQTIVLKDGSRLAGAILLDSADMLMVKLAYPQVVNIHKSQVVSIETYSNPFQTLSQSNGYYIHFTSNLLVGRNDNGDATTMSFQISNGYQFSNGISLGLGSGIENFGVNMLPLYADLKFHTWNSRISPFVYMRGGYSFALSDERTVYYEDFYYTGYKQKGGILLNGGVGIAMFTWNNAAVNIGMGYRFQMATTTYDNPWWTSTYRREIVTYFNRFEIQIGIIFR